MSGLLVGVGDDSVRSVTVIAPGVIGVGSSFGSSSGQAGTVRFPGWRAGGPPPRSMSLVIGHSAPMIGRRTAVFSQNVRIRSGEVELAATFTRPDRPGRVPAVVIVHGSGPETRAMLDLWTQLYVSLGLGVLAYDKRGVGDSTGSYPGDYASTTTLQLLAGDAARVVEYVRTRPDVDPQEVGLYGGSQGGWVVPLTDRIVHPAFNIIASGPPVSVGQQGVWASLTSDGANQPTESSASIASQLAGARTTGYDPLPFLATDSVPMLWLFGGADLHVPTTLAIADLERLHRPNFTWRVFPGCSHNLLFSGSGLDTADDAATHFGHRLFADISAFVGAKTHAG